MGLEAKPMTSPRVHWGLLPWEGRVGSGVRYGLRVYWCGHGKRVIVPGSYLLLLWDSEQVNLYIWPLRAESFF